MTLKDIHIIKLATYPCQSFKIKVRKTEGNTETTKWVFHILCVLYMHIYVVLDLQINFFLLERVHMKKLHI